MYHAHQAAPRFHQSHPLGCAHDQHRMGPVHSRPPIAAVAVVLSVHLLLAIALLWGIAGRGLSVALLWGVAGVLLGRVATCTTSMAAGKERGSASRLSQGKGLAGTGSGRHRGSASWHSQHSSTRIPTRPFRPCCRVYVLFMLCLLSTHGCARTPRQT
jgi:hypothetical protein